MELCKTGAHMTPAVQPFLLKKDTNQSCDPITEGRRTRNNNKP